MKKKTITKAMIARVYYQTIDTQPFYETKGKTHFERIIDFLELNDYNITNNSISNIYKYIQVRKDISKQIIESIRLESLNK
jgi:hypothetical protein